MPAPVGTNKVFMSTSGWVFTPNNSAIPAQAIDEVTNFQLGRGGDRKPFYGDGKAYPVKVVTRNRARSITLTTGNIATQLQIPESVTGVLTGVIMDPDNGAGSGSLVVTLSNSQLVTAPSNARDNEYADGTLHFEAYSPDGTDPLTVTITP